MNAHATFPDIVPADIAERMNPRVLMQYVGGAPGRNVLKTFGHYGSSADAKRMCGEVGKWTEINPGSDNWQSEDGRWLILQDYTAAPGFPGADPVVDLDKRDADAFRRRYGVGA